jgi:hypothetical protein
MKNMKKIAVGIVATTLSGIALADDPGVAAINSLATTAQSYITASFGVAVLVAGGFWGIKMMKKAFGKAA